MRIAGRIDAIDAARGCAMVLVCLSHIRQHFDVSSPTISYLLGVITRIATPTFLLLSGFIAGYLLRGDKPRIGITLIDRGLFLLVVAHLLLGLAHLPEVSLFEWLFARVTITDAIGVALCMAVLFRKFSGGALLALGVSVCVLSWVIGFTGAAQSAWANHLGGLLFNLSSAPNPLVNVALAPYLAVFMLGMALSAHLHGALTSNNQRFLARRLLTIGACGVTAALIGVLAWHASKNSLPDALREPYITDLLRATLDPRRKWPPSPAYLLFYSGIGLLLAGVFFHRRPALFLEPVIRTASTIGRASLMCFVVQDWLLFVVPAAFGFKDVVSTSFWFAYFAATVLTLYVLARLWGEARGNRFLTLGLKRLAGRREKRQRTLIPDHGNDAAPVRH
ncbi:MAG: acyltransferase family protein [Steroidobacter sp.]